MTGFIKKGLEKQMSKMVDISGMKFNRIKVINCANIHRGKKLQWNAVCNCGKKLLVSGAALRSGNTKSCGCLKREFIKNLGRKYFQQPKGVRGRLRENGEKDESG